MAEILACKLKEKGLIKLINEFLTTPIAKYEFLFGTIGQIEKNINRSFDKILAGDLEPGVKAIMVIAEYFDTHVWYIMPRFFTHYDITYGGVDFMNVPHDSSSNNGPDDDKNRLIFARPRNDKYIDFFTSKNKEIVEKNGKSSNNILDIKIRADIGQHSFICFLQEYEKSKKIPQDYLRSRIDVRKIYRDFHEPDFNNFIEYVCAYYNVKVKWDFQAHIFDLSPRGSPWRCNT